MEFLAVGRCGHLMERKGGKGDWGGQAEKCGYCSEGGGIDKGSKAWPKARGQKGGDGTASRDSVVFWFRVRLIRGRL